MIAADGIPEAWPRWLNREQLRAYLGDLSDASLRQICPVAPIDLGVNVLRYRRAEIDAWEATLPHKTNLRPTESGEQDAPAANDRPTSAVEKALARAKR